MAATRFSFPIALALAGCSPAPESRAASISPCRYERFEGSSFIRCDPASTQKLRLYAAGRGEAPKRRFRDLRLKDTEIAFAMNAGMFDQAGRPIGLAIANGRTVHEINLKDGAGNFHLKPNGVFVIRKDGRAEVIESTHFEDRDGDRLATQSGPMLVVGGKIHPRFEADGDSRYVRNGVGIAPGGKPVFVFSEDVVSFGKLARYFRDRVRAKDALYFDGSVSSLWDPANGRADDFTDLGPIIVAMR